MAVYIPIKKVAVDGNRVIYEYSQPVMAQDPFKAKRLMEVGRNVGRVSLDLISQQFTHESGSEWDNGFFFQRVCTKLSQHFVRGELPDETSYAA